MQNSSGFLSSLPSRRRAASGVLVPWTLSWSSHLVVASMLLTLQASTKGGSLQHCSGSLGSYRRRINNLLDAGRTETVVARKAVRE